MYIVLNIIRTSTRFSEPHRQRNIFIKVGEAKSRVSISQVTVLVIWQDSDVKEIHSLKIKYTNYKTATHDFYTYLLEN